MRIIRNFDLASLSYIAIGPVVEKIYIVNTRSDIANLPDNTKVLGNASNILFTDNAVDMNFCRLSSDDSIAILDTDKSIVRIPGGMSIKTAVNALAEKNICGLEHLYPIPGTIGGMIRMNAGADNMSISDSLTEIYTCKGRIKREEIVFDYRKSSISDIVLYAVFKLNRGDCRNIRKNIFEIMEKRNSAQPMFSKSLGSVYKNPPGHSAWELIDKIGYRDKCINDICVSSKHCNFIINRNGGKAVDFLMLTEQIEKNVFDAFGIRLEKEIEIL